MNRRTKTITGTILVVLVALSVLIINARKASNDQFRELVVLHTGNISSITIKPVIDYSDVTFDHNQTVRLVHALNNAIELPEPKPDQIISMEIIIILSNGKQISIGDSGEAEFLVTINTKSKPQNFMIASTDLKDLLLPYQNIFKREISLKKNIALYGTERITGYVREDTPVREEASNYSEEVFILEQGNLVRTLGEKTSHGVQWIFIDTVVFNTPNPVGWVESTKITTQLPSVEPNEGFIQEVNLYAEPSVDSLVLQNFSGAAHINNRAGDWAHCSVAGGLDGWVKEKDLSYTFPNDYDMGY